jgi:hypothetical protein
MRNGAHVDINHLLDSLVKSGHFFLGYPIYGKLLNTACISQDKNNERIQCTEQL